MEYRTINLDREKLYEAVWEKSTVQLAKEHGISDVALAKICKKLKVPKPAPGYWRRKERGFKVNRPPLPAVKEYLGAVSHVRVNPPASREQIPAEFTSPLKSPPATIAMHPTVKQRRGHATSSAA